MYKPFLNSVPKEASRIIHLEVMKAVSEVVMQTAGPKGSTTMIMQNNGLYPIFSKDGKKVLDHINIFGEVENGILDQLKQITETVVARVGDGTTSAVELSYLIFEQLCEVEKSNALDMNTYDIINEFKKAVSGIIDIIKKAGRPLTINDVYDICMISTNGDEELSTRIYNIYKEFGTDVYIDLKTSTTADYMIKTYDGLTISKGFASPAYVNKITDSVQQCDIRNPRIYVFKDPIDTPEMIGFFTNIVYNNILIPFNNIRTIADMQRNPAKYAAMPKEDYDKIESNAELIPTVIMCPFISRDASACLESLESLCYSFDKDEVTRMQKPPICIVKDLATNVDELSDISVLCGCKVIGKYIDESVQKEDIKNGKAPTIENVTEFYGEAEQVIIDKEKTKFINPIKMFETDKDGEYVLDANGDRVYSATYDSIVSFLKGALQDAEENGADVVEKTRIKRRLNGLTSSLVELYIGGISVTDRESKKDLADDAVRNCRSAAATGVGRACNFEGLLASKEIMMCECTEVEATFRKIIYDAYEKVVKQLYATCISKANVDEAFAESVTIGRPINLRTGEVDATNVLTSIDTDVAILDCISRIVTIMFTSNQILVGEAFNNKYASIGSEDE